MQEPWVRLLGWEDPLEKEMTAHSTILTWRIPWTDAESDTTERLTFSFSFCNKGFMMWATVSSQCCFCWLYRASLIFGCKEYNQSDFGIDYLVIPMRRVFSFVVGRGCLLWPVHSLGKTLLAFALFHFLVEGQICLLVQVSLDFLLLHSSPQ